MCLKVPGDIKRWASVCSRVVQICGVLACLYSELLVTLQGVCNAQKTPAQEGPGGIHLMTWSFKTPRTHVINFSVPLLVVKQKHVAGNKVVQSYLEIRNNDDRDSNQKMTCFRT